ncbi:MAG: hypothetical protein RLO12_11005 [Fulvivirga sp.]
MKDIPFLDLVEFYCKWKIDLKKTPILITVHPKTKGSVAIGTYVYESFKCFSSLVEKYQLVFTKSNADTLGDLYSEQYKRLKDIYLEKHL